MDFLQQFRMYFPELSSATDERVLFFRDIADNTISASRWGKCYQEGLLNLTAHLLVKRFGPTGNGSPISSVPDQATSKTIGKISKGVESKNSGNFTNAGDYALTPYGRRYWELLQLILPTVLVISGNSGCAGTFSR